MLLLQSPLNHLTTISLPKLYFCSILPQILPHMEQGTVLKPETLTPIVQRYTWLKPKIEAKKPEFLTQMNVFYLVLDIPR